MKKVHTMNTKHCAGCQSGLKNNNYIICTIKECSKHFHFQCVNIKNQTPEIIAVWICPDCCSSNKKGGDNSSTPVRSNSSVTLRKPRTNTNSEESSQNSTSLQGSVPEHQGNMSDLTMQVRYLREDVSSIKADFQKAIAALNRCEERLDGLTGKMTQYERRLKEAEEKVLQIPELCMTISSLQEQINHYSQALLRNEIEIAGITETTNENLHHTVHVMAAKIGIKLSQTDIEYVHRAGPPKDQNHLDVPRFTVVRFARRNIRDEFYKAARTRHLTTNDIEIEGSLRKIYCNERLTRVNRLLFRDCRAACKEAGFKYCWTSGGTIFVKKQEGNGTRSKAFPVRSLDELQAEINRHK